MKSQMNLQFNLATEDEGTTPLEAKIEQFKQDSEKMEVVTDFVDEVLQKAQVEVDRKSAVQKRTEKEKCREGFSVLNNLKRGRAGVAVTRARGVVIRLFEAICNCTTNAPVPSQARPATS